MRALPFLLLCLSSAAVSAQPEHFFVAPSGSDTAPGTRERPFRTVARARDAVRALRGAPTDVIVEIAAGTYQLAETLTFGPEDSGRGGHRVTYRAAGGAPVVLSGGRRITGWQADTGGRYRARVRLPDFRQLWVNGRRATRARGKPPELAPWGELQAVVHPAPGLEPAGTLEVTADAGYESPDLSLLTWHNPGDVEFGYYVAWTHVICPVQSIAPDGEQVRITMRQPCFFLASRKGGVQIGMPDYVENALELLDEPGEWYFDRAAGWLYYLPRPGEEMATAEVIAPALETLLEVRGELGRPVHDLSFEGLTFAHATWLRPSEYGHPDVQANFIAWPEGMYQRPENEHGYTSINGEIPKSPANVVVDAARDIRVEGCTFTALGGAGLDLQHGAQRNVVDWCRFEDISATGIQVGDVQREDHHPTDPRRTVKGNRITNNTITRCGVEYQDSIGVFCGYTDGTVIAHNEISELPYTGVSVGWGWGMPDAGGGGYTSPQVYDTPTVCRRNRIEYNHIHHVMQQRTDGGGIYTLSRQPGTIIRGNHIHDNGPGVPGGIYLDEGSADIEVTGNLVYAVGRAMNYNNYAQNRIATCREHDDLFDVPRQGPGLIGHGLLCGPGSLLEVPYAVQLDPPELTVEAWVRISAYPGGWDPRRWVVCKAAHEFADTNYSLYIDQANVGAYLNIGGGQENCFTAVSTTNPLPLNTWCPVACTYDGQTLRTYCDGNEVAATQVGRPRTLGNAPLALGGRQDRYSYFEGDLDEVRIYKRALSADEIRHNLEAVRSAAGGQQAAAITDSLAGYWNFEDIAMDQERINEITAAAGPEPLLQIEWRLGPDYPMGIQDSAVGIVDGQVVSAGGFTRWPLDIVARYPDAFGGEPSGFTRLAFAFDPAHEEAGWQRIADMPGPARQGPAVAVAGDALYVVGGINYTEPYTYRETYRLRHRDGQWTWEELPSARLPWPVYGAAASTAVIGSRIYLLGAADFFPAPGIADADFHSEAGREGSPVSRALLVLDTDDLRAGWRRLADCPGLPQFDAGVAAAGGKLYRLGGIYAPLDPGDGSHYFNAVDGWVYDRGTDAWARLRDLPDGANRRALSFEDRYVLLAAGYKYPQTWHVDGTRTDAYTTSEKSRDWRDFFEPTVLVYDTELGRLGRATPLIERTSYPSSAIVGDTAYCLGGEGGPRLWHPATFQIGRVTPASPGGAVHGPTGHTSG